MRQLSPNGVIGNLVLMHLKGGMLCYFSWDYQDNKYMDSYISYFYENEKDSLGKSVKKGYYIIAEINRKKRIIKFLDVDKADNR